MSKLKLNRLECRDVLACIDRERIDPDVLGKLIAGADYPVEHEPQPTQAELHMYAVDRTEQALYGTQPRAVSRVTIMRDVWINGVSVSLPNDVAEQLLVGGTASSVPPAPPRRPDEIVTVFLVGDGTAMQVRYDQATKLVDAKAATWEGGLHIDPVGFLGESTAPSLHPLLIAIYGKDANVTDVPQYTPIVLEPKMQVTTWDAQGREVPPVTQADVDHWNESRKLIFETQAKMRLRKPDFNPAHADTAEFAQPEMPRGWVPPRTSYGVGEPNRGGDPCIGYDAGGAPLFRCRKDDSHNYTENQYMAGCPTCFMLNSGGEGADTDGSSAVEGQDGQW